MPISILMLILMLNLARLSKMKGAEDPHFFMPCVGEYDLWAIKYGYMIVQEEEMLTQHEVTKKINEEEMMLGYIPVVV